MLSAKRVCDRVALLVDGDIRARGAPQDLEKKPQQAFKSLHQRHKKEATKMSKKIWVQVKITVFIVLWTDSFKLLFDCDWQLPVYFYKS